MYKLREFINTKGTTYKKLKEQGIKDITPEVVLQNCKRDKATTYCEL